MKKTIVVADTAAFTANVALDPTAPRFLCIAGDRLSPRQIQAVAAEVTGHPFRLFRAGGPGLLSLLIKIARALAPGKKELYPAFQGMQYMRNMIDERAKLSTFDNGRYPDMRWTSVKDVLSAQQASTYYV